MENKIINKYITIRDEILLRLPTIQQNDIKYDKLRKTLDRIEIQINTYNGIMNALNRKMQLRKENKSTYQLESVGINKLIRKLQKELEPILVNEIKTIYNINNLTDEFDPYFVSFTREYNRNNKVVDIKEFFKEEKKEVSKKEEKLVVDADAFIERFNANNGRVDINNFFKQEDIKTNIKQGLKLLDGQKHNITKPSLVKESKEMRKERLLTSQKLIYGGLSLFAISMAPFINSFTISTLLAFSSIPIIGTGYLLKNKHKVEKYNIYNREIDKLYGLYNLSGSNLRLYKEINNLISLIENDKKLTDLFKRQLLSKIKNLAKKVNIDTREEQEEFDSLNKFYDIAIANIKNNENHYIKVETINEYYKYVNNNNCLTADQKEFLLKKVDYIAKHFDFNPASVEVVVGFNACLSDISSKIYWYYTSNTNITQEEVFDIKYRLEDINQKISFNKFIPLQEKLNLIGRIAHLDNRLNYCLDNTRVEGKKIS